MLAASSRRARVGPSASASATNQPGRESDSPGLPARQGIARFSPQVQSPAKIRPAMVTTIAKAESSGALILATASCITSMPMVMTFLPPSSVAET